MPLALLKIQGDKWAITRQGLDTIIEIASGNGNLELLKIALEQKAPARALRSDILTKTAQGLMIKGDTAVISINGPIIPYANQFSEMSGCCSIETIKKQFIKSLSDNSIKRILFDIDSPGGNVTEVHSLAQMIFEARSTKLIEAYIGGYGCSAAYWIASAASKIYIDKTGEAGSIGVVLGFTDTTNKDEKEGIRREQITNTDSPKKRLKLDSKEFKESMVAIADDIAEVFIEDVARNRGISVETVKKDFGQGGVLTGKKAVKAGLCDQLATFEELFKPQSVNNQEKKSKMDQELKDALAENAKLKATIEANKATITSLETQLQASKDEFEKKEANTRKDKFDALVNDKVKEGTGKGHSEDSAEMKNFKATFSGNFEKFSALDDEVIKSTISTFSFSQAKKQVKEPGNHNFKSSEAPEVDYNNV